MKPLYLFLQVVVAILLLVNCSGKERFYFNRTAGSFGSTYGFGKVEKQRISADSNSCQLMHQETERTETSFLTASAGDTAQAPGLRLQKQMPLIKNTIIPTTRKEATSQDERLARTSESLVATRKIKKAAQNDEAVMNRKARIGLGFGLAAVAFVLLAIAFGPLPFLAAAVAAIVGLLTSRAALSEIKRNPGKFTGKGKAWAGIIINATMLLLFLVVLWYALALVAFFSGLQ